MEEDEGEEQDEEVVRESETDQVERETTGWGERKAGGNPNVCFILQMELKKTNRNVCSQTDVITAK